MNSRLQFALIGGKVLRCLPVIVGALALLACCCPIAPPAAPQQIVPAADQQAQGLGDGLANATTNSLKLNQWCLTARGEIADANAANPIRGKELDEARLAALRGRLLGKQVRWQFQVLKIDNGGKNATIDIRGHIPNMVDLDPGTARRLGFTRIDAPALRVHFPPQQSSFDNGLLTAVRVEDRWSFTVTPQRARDLTVGHPVTVVGMVTRVDGGFSVVLADARIE